jgi:hypothetical protein
VIQFPLLTIIPGSASAESGTLRLGEEETVQAAVVQTFITANGPVQIVFPTSAVDGVIKQLQDAKDEAEQQPITSADLVIPGSAQEVNDVKAAHDEINRGKQ